MKFSNGLRISLSGAGLPVNDREVYVHVSAGDSTMYGGALITRAEARAFVDECRAYLDTFNESKIVQPPLHCAIKTTVVPIVSGGEDPSTRGNYGGTK